MMVSWAARAAVVVLVVAVAMAVAMAVSTWGLAAAVVGEGNDKLEAPRVVMALGGRRSGGKTAGH